MKSRNMINYPVVLKELVNGKLTKSSVRTYMNNNGRINLKENYTLNTNIPLNDFIELSVGDAGNNAYTIDPRMNQETVYTYYSSGKIKEVYSPKTGMTTTYLWGYYNQYPIAKIEMGSYNTVSYVLSGIDIEAFAAAEFPNMSQLNILRTSQYLNNAQITTYTYKPLVGMTSQTDPRGVTTYYEYDDFNRLKFIKDNQGDVIQRFDYHYKE